MAISIKKPDDLKLMGGMETPNGTTVSGANKNPIDMYSTTPESVNVGNKPTATDIYQDALSKAEKEKNYENYYNTAMQLYNYEQNSKKYLANSMANAGLNTQGYGSSQMAGISNNAMNLYSQNLANLNKANTEADLAALERKNADDLENDKQLVTYLSYSDSPEMISKYLNNYGYTYDSENGTWKDKNGNEMNSYLKSSLDTALANINGYVNEDGTIEMEGESTSSSSFASLDALGDSKWREGNGAWKLKNRFTYALDFVKNYTSRNDLSAGTVIYMTDYKGNQCYVKVNNDGSYSYATKDDYLKANDVLNCVYGKMMNKGEDGRYTSKLTEEQLNEKNNVKF